MLIAEFGEDNGVALYAENQHALARLVKACLAGAADPALFVARTDQPQEGPTSLNGDDIAWAPPYAARFPSPQLSAALAKAHELSSFYMGGLPAPAARH